MRRPRAHQGFKGDKGPQGRKPGRDLGKVQSPPPSSLGPHLVRTQGEHSHTKYLTSPQKGLENARSGQMSELLGIPAAPPPGRASSPAGQHHLVHNVCVQVSWHGRLPHHLTIYGAQTRVSQLAAGPLSTTSAEKASFSCVLHYRQTEGSTAGRPWA